VLDLGTGCDRPVPPVRARPADQLVIVTTAEWTTQQLLVDTLDQMRHEHTTLVHNKARKNEALTALTGSFGERRLHRFVSVPHDTKLGLMLDSGTFSVGAPGRGTRMGIKRLGLSVCEQLV